MIQVFVLLLVIALAGLGVWHEVRLGNIEKDIRNLKFAKGQDIPRQEFDALKNLVHRLRRDRKEDRDEVQ